LRHWKFGVGGDARTGPRRSQFGLEVRTGNAEHGLAEHLDEAPVRVPGEPFVAALRRQSQHARIGQADVENRLHHAGHRELAARTDRQQQRIVRVAEVLLHPGLDQPQMLLDLGEQPGRDRAGAKVGPAGLGGDREAGRHRQPHPRHFREIGALAAEQILEILVALREVIHVPGHPAHPHSLGAFAVFFW
jgi:hypothetical protein